MPQDIKKINDFKTAMAFVLKWEGGAKYTNDPKDPGGETKFGISKRAHPEEDIKNLTPQRALEIYANDYWHKVGCDDIPSPLNIVVFDTAVNCGVGRAKDWLRKAKDVEEFLSLRKEYYVRLASTTEWASKYLNGWLNRLNDLTKLVALR